MHTMPSEKQRGPRKTPSAAMAAQRERFGAITKMVAQMLEEGSSKNRKQLWKIATEAYDAAHQ